MALNVPAYLSDYATNKLREDGVDVHTKVVIKDFQVNEQHALTNDQNATSSNQSEGQNKTSNFTLTLSNDAKLETDHVGEYYLFTYFAKYTLRLILLL